LGLTYESLEKLKVGKPVDRLSYISAACTGKIVLDIGCFDETALEKRGTEHWLHGRILQVATEVFGIDISDKIPAEGVVTGPNGRILRRDAVKLDLSGIPVEKIQTIVAGEFVEHVESPMDFFRQVKQKLSGRDLLISTPNGVCFANTLMGVIGREVQHPDHLHNLTYKTLNTQCLRSGFESWEIVPYQFYATEMILASTGPKRMLVKLVQACVRGVEWCFPLLSFGYIVRIRV
jgi:SAM-dependent methyltransferase